VNTFEVAVLRVLVKRHEPLKLSILVNGFPDDCENDVLAAISQLKLDGYVTLSDYQPDGYVSISKDRRREILQIVGSDIYPRKVDLPAPSEEKKSPRYRTPPQIRTVTIASLFVFGIVAVLIPTVPATSTDTEFVVHHHNFDHWHAYGVNNADSGQPTTTFVAWQNCDQKQQS